MIPLSQYFICYVMKFMTLLDIIIIITREIWVQISRVILLVLDSIKYQKWYLMPSCLTQSIIKYVSRVKWSNPGKGVAPSPTPRCSSYRKGSLRVTLDYGCQQQQLLLFYVFHWSLRDKSKTLLSILADLNNAVVWMVSTRPLISKSF